MGGQGVNSLLLRVDGLGKCTGCTAKHIGVVRYSQSLCVLWCPPWWNRQDLTLSARWDEDGDAGTRGPSDLVGRATLKANAPSTVSARASTYSEARALSAPGPECLEHLLALYAP